MFDKEGTSRGLKSQNFPVGRLKRAKTFRTECINHFCDQCVKKAHKLFLRHIHQYVFATFMYQKWLICLETFKVVWKLTGCLETFQVVWNLSRLSGIFPGCLETFRVVWKLSRLSGNFPGHLETFQFVWKLSRSSTNFPGCLEAF